MVNQKRWAFACATGTAINCGDVDLQAIASTVGLFANKHIALIHEWHIAGNFAIRMHKTLSTNVSTIHASNVRADFTVICVNCRCNLVMTL